MKSGQANKEPLFSKKNCLGLFINFRSDKTERLFTKVMVRLFLFRKKKRKGKTILSKEKEQINLLFGHKN
jgi:hypothetical protein